MLKHNFPTSDRDTFSVVLGTTSADVLAQNGPKTPHVGTEGETGVQTIPRLETPKMYVVLLMNDDYTPMDFVVLVLRRFFGKNEDEATQVMLDVHKKGSGVAGVFTLEVAEMKVMQVNQFARVSQHPLKSTLEEA